MSDFNSGHEFDWKELAAFMLTIAAAVTIGFLIGIKHAPECPPERAAAFQVGAL